MHLRLNRVCLGSVLLPAEQRLVSHRVPRGLRVPAARRHGSAIMHEQLSNHGCGRHGLHTIRGYALFVDALLSLLTEPLFFSPGVKSLLTYSSFCTLQGYADGVGSNACLKWPSGVAVSSAGTVFVVDNGHHDVRTVSLIGNTSVTSLFAGWGVMSTLPNTPASFTAVSGSVDGALACCFVFELMFISCLEASFRQVKAPTPCSTLRSASFLIPRAPCS